MTYGVVQQSEFLRLNDASRGLANNSFNRSANSVDFMRKTCFISAVRRARLIRAYVAHFSLGGFDMKRITMLVSLIICALCNSTPAQTMFDFDSKFGPPVKVYPANEHIWIAPAFADDGQLCMVRLFPKQIDSKTNYLWDRLPLTEVKEVLEQLAPTASRGQRKADNGWFISGGMAFSGVEYEHVRINFTAFINSRPSWTQSSSARGKEDAEFPGPWAQSAQIVTISWLDRTCSPQ